VIREDASPAPIESARQFALAFWVSLLATITAVLIFNLTRPVFALDWLLLIVVVSLLIITGLVGVWFYHKREVQTARGIIWGFTGGLFMAFIGLLLIALVLLNI